jgi:hypothetical protein
MKGFFDGEKSTPETVEMMNEGALEKGTGRKEVAGNGSDKQCCGSGTFIPDPNFFHP